MRKLASIVIIVVFASVLFATLPTQSMTWEWSEPEQLTSDVAQDYSSSIMQDASGKIWVIWTKDKPSTLGDIWYITSTDGGANWTPEDILVNDTLQEAPRTNMFQDSTGRIWVVWTSGQYSPRIDWDIYYITSEDGGEHWSIREKLTPGSEDDGSPSLIEVSGEVWIVFNKQPSSNKIWYYKLSIEDLERTGPYNVSTESSARVVTPCAMVDSTGRIWLVWTQHGDVHYKTSIDNGTSWSSDKHVIATANTETLPYIVEDNFGNVTVFYNIYDGGTPDDIGYRTSGDGGINWSNQKMAVSDAHTNTSPYAAFFDYRIWVLWSSDKSGNIDLWLTKTEPGRMSASVDIDPDTLNLKSNGQWITAYITLPNGSLVEEIDITSVELKYDDWTLLADWGDVQGGVLMVKFDRIALRDHLGEIDFSEGSKFYDISLTVSGELIDGTSFEGSDTVAVLRK